MKQIVRNITFLILAIVFAVSPAFSIDPDEVLEDSVLEARAREISKGLRCVVCKNQSIDESDASLAKDLRLLVRERVKAGDTNEEVTDYVVDRYGEFVLLRPRFSGRNLFLWGAPVFVLFTGTFLVFYFLRQQKQPDMVPKPLSEDEQAELAKLVDDREES